MITGQEEDELEAPELGAEPVEKAVVVSETDIAQESEGVCFDGKIEKVRERRNAGQLEVEIAEDLDAYWLERESIRWLRRFVMGRKVGIGWGGRAEIDERPERERSGRGGLRE